MGFIRTLLILIIVYYLVKVVMRYLLPALFGKYVNSKMNEFSNQRDKSQSRKNTKKEGEVTVDNNVNSTRKNPGKRGEYIDYEEIKD